MSNAPFEHEHTQAVPDQIEFTEDLTEEVWVEDTSGPGLVARMTAEAVGTFIFILLALTVAVFTDSKVLVLLGFAVPLWAMIVMFGGVSGGHFNPAVSVGVWIAGRFPGRDVTPYILAQVVGASAAGATLWALLGSNPQVTDARTIVNSVAIGFADRSPTQFPWGAGFAVEVIATAIFVGVILAATSVRAVKNLAPVTIGLTLGALLMFAIPFTNGALNPARATGAALFAETWALEQLWLFWLAPVIGGAIAGLLVRAFGPEEDIERIEVIEVVEEIREA